MAYGGYTQWYSFYSILPLEPGAVNNSIFLGTPGNLYGIDLSPFHAQNNARGIRFRYDPVTDDIEVSLSLILSTLHDGAWSANEAYWNYYGHTVPAGSGDAIINSFAYRIYVNGVERSVPHGPHANTLGPVGSGLQSNGDAYIYGAPNQGQVFRLEHTFTMKSGVGDEGTASFTFSMNVFNSLTNQTAIAMNGVTFSVAEVLGTYVPMAIRRSNAWRALNTAPAGFIRKRVGGSWSDFSTEQMGTSKNTNTGKNRIRSGSWKQLPPM